MGKGVSIIVCCYNSAGRLHETLGHLLKQQTTGFEWEIIVVDNASTDSTGKVAEQLLSKGLSSEKFKVVHEPQPGLSSARRKGYLSSRYDYLLFCDDDNWMEKDYLQVGFDTMEKNNRMGILGGTGEAVFEKEKPQWFDTFQINFAVGEQSQSLEILSKTETVYGAGMIVRRQIFEKLDAIQFQSLLSDRKGSQLMSGGDTELCLVTRYLGYEVFTSRKLQFKHLMTEGRMSWDYLKKLHYGFGRMRLYLHAYNRLETSNEVPGKGLRMPFWLDTLIHRIKELDHFLPQTLFRLKEEGDETVLKYFALRGELSELWTLKKNYSSVFEKIAALKKRIASLNEQP